MEGVKFRDVLKSYEKKAEEVEYEAGEKPYDERRTIENDVNRTMFIGVNAREKEKIRLLRRLLYKVMEEIPVVYMQGMSEIASVFLLHYFDKKADQYLRKTREPVEEAVLQSGAGSEFFDESESANGVFNQGSSANNASNTTVNFVEATKEEKADAESLVSKNKDTYETLRTVLTNVFKRKFEPLVVNDFKIYKENIAVFVEMMRRRRVTISPLGSHVFMGSIFTFFTRDVRDMKNIHKVFEIVLSCPDTSLFLLLTVFHKKISKNERILEISDNLFPEVIELEKEFLEVKRGMQERKEGPGMKSALLLGGIAGVVAAVFIYKMSKKE
jgi:hypothetical protein